MNDWLDLGLKTMVSVLILYVAVNTFWRYHPFAKARHAVSIFVVSLLIVAFYESERPLWLIGFLAAGLVVEGAMYFWERKSHQTVYWLLLSDKAHQVAISEYLKAASLRHGLSPNRYRFAPGCAVLLLLDDSQPKTWKPLLKELERDFKSLVPILALRAYATVVFALILLAAYWRYW